MKCTVEIETLPLTHIVGTAQNYTMETRQYIPQQWSVFFEADYQVDNVVPGAMYGLSFMADGVGGFRYGVGVEVNTKPETTPEGTCWMYISKGEYAVQRAFGPVVELPGHLDAMFSEWLPASNYVQREGAVFERYPEDSRNGPGGMAYEIWVPVVAKG